MRELVREEGWDVYHCPALLKGLYEASAYSFLHRAEKGPWKAGAHNTDLQNQAVLHGQRSDTDN